MNEGPPRQIDLRPERAGPDAVAPLFGHLAHSLRNLIAPLSNAMHVIEIAEARGDASAQARAVMWRQIDQMTRLADDLLDAARLRGHRFQLERTHVPLAVVLEAALRSIRAWSQSAGHELFVSIPAQPLIVEADLNRLIQVFTHLINHSARHTDRGGRIWLSAERRGREAVVTIVNDGDGLDAESLSHLFDQPQSLESTGDESADADGLGFELALVKELIGLHGGDVRAESGGESRGCTFTARLPVADDDSPSALVPTPRTAPADPRPATPRRVLVVDDHPDIAATFALMFRLLGHDVHVAHDGAQGLEIAERLHPDTLLLDVDVPHIDGYDLARRIRQLSWAGAATIVSITGWGRSDDDRHSRQAGCDAHLLKPVSLAELEQALRTPARPAPRA